MPFARKFYALCWASVLLLGGSLVLQAQTSPPVEKTDSTAAIGIVPLGYDSINVRTASATLSTLRAGDFNGGILFNPLAAIAGRLPGLFVTPVHGDPNGETAAVLRGWNSIFGRSDPLYVVDGVPGVPVDNIAVEDIESVTLVKDASQAGVYGARAGNGVLLVSTRRGRPHVTYHGYAGVAHAASRPEVLTAGEYRRAVRQLGRESRFIDRGADTDWFGEVTRPAYTHNHQLGVSGGTGPATFRFSGGYLGGQGVVRKSGLERLNGRFNADAQLLRNRLHLSLSASAMHTTRHDLPEDLVVVTLRSLPTDPVYNPDGSYWTNTLASLPNPRAMLDWSNQKRQHQEWLGSFRARYSILDGLSAGVGYAVRKNNGESTRRRRNLPDSGYYFTGESTSQEVSRWLDLSVQYQKRLKKHFFDVQLRGLRQFDERRDSTRERNFYPGIGGGESYSVIKTSYSGRLRTYSAQFSYSFAGVWLAHVNLVRHEDFDLYNDRWQPSASVAWVIGDDKEWSGNALLNGLKWRLHWGKSSTTGIPHGPYVFTFPNALAGSFARPDVESYGSGVDFAFLKHKLTGSLDWYTRTGRHTEKLVSGPGAPLPLLHPQYSIRNRGTELFLRASLFSKPGLRWDAAFAGAVNRSKIVGSDFKRAQILSNQDEIWTAVLENEPAGLLYGIMPDGMAGGFPVYKDQDGDGHPDPMPLGSVQPVLTASLRNTWTLAGNLEVGVTFVAAAGNKVFDGKRYVLAFSENLSVRNVSPQALTFAPNAPIAPSLFVENGSFVRLDNCLVGYGFARNGRRFYRARVYVAGRNLFRLPASRGVDPEEGVRGVNTFGNFYPASRSFNAGLDVQR